MRSIFLQNFRALSTIVKKLQIFFDMTSHFLCISMNLFFKDLYFLIFYGYKSYIWIKISFITLYHHAFQINMHKMYHGWLFHAECGNKGGTAKFIGSCVFILPFELCSIQANITKKVARRTMFFIMFSKTT